MAVSPLTAALRTDPAEVGNPAHFRGIPMTRPIRTKPVAAGDIRTIVLNGSKLTERFDGLQWITIKVEPA